MTIARVTMRQRTASRRARVRSGKAHRNKARPPAVLLHDVKQPASRPSPRSTSRSRGAFFAPGSSRRVSLSPPHSPLHVPALRRARAKSLASAAAPALKMRGRRNAGRRYCRRRARKCATLTLAGVPVPRNRDVRLSALHRGAVGPGPLSRSGVAAGSGAMGCSRQAPSCLTAEPGFSYPSVTSRGRRHAPAPPSAGSLLESAL